MAGLKRLRIENSKLLLLEMPMERWTEYTVKELEELAGFGDCRIVLAHIERYLPMQSERTWERLYNSRILMQANASFFIEMRSSRKAINFLKKGKIQFVGSDCHRMTARPPRIGEAYERIEKKLGSVFVSQMNEYGYSKIAQNL